MPLQGEEREGIGEKGRERRYNGRRGMEMKRRRNGRRYVYIYKQTWQESFESRVLGNKKLRQALSLCQHRGNLRHKSTCRLVKDRPCATPTHLATVWACQKCGHFSEFACSSNSVVGNWGNRLPVVLCYDQRAGAARAQASSLRVEREQSRYLRVLHERCSCTNAKR